MPLTFVPAGLRWKFVAFVGALVLVLATAGATMASRANPCDGPAGARNPNCVEGEFRPPGKGLHKDPVAGTITIVKNAQGADGELFSFESYALPDLDGTPDREFALLDGQSRTDTLPPGSYRYYEPAGLLPDGWLFERVECDSGEWAVDGNLLDVTVRADEHITCTFYNVRAEEEQLPLIVVGAGSVVPHVKVFDGRSLAERHSFFAHGGLSDGVRVAVGDVDGDGVPDVIAGTAPGTGAAVQVFSGTDASLLLSFSPFSGFTGGVFVAAGDVNGDGHADIVVGAATSVSHVKVFDGATGTEISSFFAFPGFTGGVTVAAGDINGDGRADIIVGTATGGSHVKVFDGATGAEISSFFAYPGFTGGVFVAAGDVSGDGLADIITGVVTDGSHVKVFGGRGLDLLHSFFAYPGFTGGVTVAAGDINGDGRADIITGAGPGAGPHVKVFDGTGLADLQSFFAFPPTFTGGVFVAGWPPNSPVED